MLAMNDIENIESGCNQTEEDFYSSVQRAINSGSAWSLQGSYGRTMMQAIEDGFCCLGRNPTRDYWGNRIPSRFEVMSGTKGSMEYVRQQSTDEWADMIEAIE